MGAYPIFQQLQSFIKSIVHSDASGRIDQPDTPGTRTWTMSKFTYMISRNEFTRLHQGLAQSQTQCSDLSALDKSWKQLLQLAEPYQLLEYEYV